MTLVIVTTGRSTRDQTHIAFARPIRTTPSPIAMNIKRLCTAVLLAGAAFAAHAADNTPITDCIDLSSNQEIVRGGGAQSMLLRDGDAHYLVGFRGDCSSLATATSIEISTDGAANRLCPKGSKVKTNRSTCSVGKIEALDADEFAARKKRVAR